MDKRRAWTLLTLYAAAQLAGFALYLVGILVAFPEIGPEPVVDPRGAILLVFGFLFLLGALALLVTWFATQNRDMNRLSGGRFNTLLWTLLLFVPVANFVSLYMFADHVRRAQTAVGVTGMPPAATFLILLLTAFALIPFIGFIVAQIQMDKLGTKNHHAAATAPLPVSPATQGGFVRVDPPPYYSGVQPVPQAHHPPDWPEDWPPPGLEAGRMDPLPPLGTRAEVIGMPTAGILMLFLSVASVPLALTGPAGIIAGTIALMARRRLLRLEQETPGHRSVRASRWSDKLAWIGVALGAMMSIVILLVALGPLLRS